MKGTEKIIAHIQADAKAEADAILAQAGQQCAGIREEYEKKAKEAYAEKIRAGVKACEELADSKMRIAQMESKKNILAMKQDLVSESFEKAKEMILALPKAEYQQLLVKLAVKAAAADKTGEVIFNAKDQKAFGDAVVKAANELLGSGSLTLSKETGNFSGGLKIKNGAIEVNNTLELLIDHSRSEMSAAVAKVLFG